MTLTFNFYRLELNKNRITFLLSDHFRKFFSFSKLARKLYRKEIRSAHLLWLISHIVCQSALTQTLHFGHKRSTSVKMMVLIESKIIISVNILNREQFLSKKSHSLYTDHSCHLSAFSILGYSTLINILSIFSLQQTRHKITYRPRAWPQTVVSPVIIVSRDENATVVWRNCCCKHCSFYRAAPGRCRWE